MTDKATHTPLPYECFQDRSYYDMWCVRRVNEREWGKGFHLVNGEEAAALRDLLNTRAVNIHHDLIEALEALLNSSGARGVYHASKHFDAVEAAESLLAALKEAGHG